MIIKKVIVFGLMLAYIYTLTFGIFMTDILRVPAPLIFGLPLLIFASKTYQPFTYFTEVGLLVCAVFLYYVVGMEDYKAFLAYSFTIMVCALYFNYFVGVNRTRFKISVAAFFSFLFISMIVMVFDHNYQVLVDSLRDLMLDEKTKQSPSGLGITQFTFGYQLITFTSFVFIATILFRLNFLIKLAVFCLCIFFIYLGMNRSVFICFTGVGVMFLLVYYRLKALPIIAAGILMGLMVYSIANDSNIDTKNNILAKNQAKQANDFNRAVMAEENLKIYADYPFGLIFYGKTWEEVTYKNPEFPDGLPSHNAYLMFFTYLGPFLGLGLIGAIYYKPLRLLR